MVFLSSISPSKFDTLEECPYKFALKHIDRMPEIFGESDGGTNAMAFGNFIHRILERGYQCKSPQDLFSICEEEKENYKFKGHSDNEIAKTLNNFYKWNSKLSETVGIEYSYKVPINDDITVIGYIDRILKTPNGHYLIVDYKTGRPKTNMELMANKQGLFYTWVIHKIFDVPYANIIFGHYYPVQDEFVAVKYPSIKVENFIYRELLRKLYELRGKKKEDLKPRRNNFCGTCGYRKICPNFSTPQQLNILLQENETKINYLKEQQYKKYKEQRNLKEPEKKD